jgi:hypothetical protein
MRSPALFARLAAGIILIPGEVAEWLNASVSKTDIAARLSRVRIPPSPYPDHGSESSSSDSQPVGLPGLLVFKERVLAGTALGLRPPPNRFLGRRA